MIEANKIVHGVHDEQVIPDINLHVREEGKHSRRREKGLFYFRRKENRISYGRRMEPLFQEKIRKYFPKIHDINAIKSVDYNALCAREYKWSL